MSAEKEASLVDQIERYLKQCYWSGANYCMGSEVDIEEPLLEIIMIVKTLTDRRAELVSVIKDLLEQHRRQDDIDNHVLWQVYPDKLPEWGRAWDNAQEVLNG